jgi:hypothetical protein
MFVVSTRTSEQSGNESPQEVRKVHVQVPKECQHQAGNDCLKHEGLVGENRLDQREQEKDRDSHERETGQNRQQLYERSEPKGNAGLRHRELTRAALAADLGIAGIRVPMLAELEIVGTSAEITEQRLAGSDPMTLIT